jgi:hypothetical protein
MDDRHLGGIERGFTILTNEEAEIPRNALTGHARRAQRSGFESKPITAVHVLGLFLILIAILLAGTFSLDLGVIFAIAGLGLTVGAVQKANSPE